MERIVFHIDVNNAYLSWTAVNLLENNYPIDIRDIVSVIGGDEKARHGVVLAKSIPAKKKNIKTAETLYSARKKDPNLKVFPPDHQLYEEMSKKMFNYLKRYSPNIEYYSIDESFLDMTQTSFLYKDIFATAEQIRREIKKEFGFTVNIGIGNNKLLAKMASDFEKPDKVHSLFKDEIEKKMWHLPVRELFMIGQKSEKALNDLGIKTIGDLAKYDLNKLKKRFKSSGLMMWQYANGIDESLVTKHVAKEKSISTSFTTPKDLDDIAQIKKILLKQSQEIGKQMRKENKKAFVVAITIKTYDFLSYSKQLTLSNAIFTSKDIYKEALSLFQQAWNQEKIRNIGIRLTKFCDESSHQISLFENFETKEKNDKIQIALDEINHKFGSSIIGPAALYEKEEREMK